MMRTSEVHHKKVVVPDKYWKGKDDVYYIARLSGALFVVVVRSQGLSENGERGE